MLKYLCICITMPPHRTAPLRQALNGIMTDSILRPIDLLELMADRIPEGPQVSSDVERAMIDLRRQGATTETLKFIWGLLGRDIRQTSGGQFIGVYRALDAGLNRLAVEIQQPRPDPAQLEDAKAKAGLG